MTAASAVFHGPLRGGAKREPRGDDGGEGGGEGAKRERKARGDDGGEGGGEGGGDDGGEGGGDDGGEGGGDDGGEGGGAGGGAGKAYDFLKTFDQLRITWGYEAGPRQAHVGFEKRTHGPLNFIQQYTDPLFRPIARVVQKKTVYDCDTIVKVNGWTDPSFISEFLEDSPHKEEAYAILSEFVTEDKVRSELDRFITLTYNHPDEKIRAMRMSAFAVLHVGVHSEHGWAKLEKEYTEYTKEEALRSGEETEEDDEDNDDY